MMRNTVTKKDMIEIFKKNANEEGNLISMKNIYDFCLINTQEVRDEIVYLEKQEWSLLNRRADESDYIIEHHAKNNSDDQMYKELNVLDENIKTRLEEINLAKSKLHEKQEALNEYKKQLDAYINSGKVPSDEVFEAIDLIL